MLDLIKRRIPAYAHRFLTETIPPQQGKNVYEIDTQGDNIVLRGDCPVSIAMALYRYLKDSCDLNWSWCGNREITLTSLPLPKKKTRQAIEQTHRVYMNYCTLGYSAAFWDWARWEKELDFMAMNGITMPLAVIGTEAVWYETLQDFGFSKQEALSFLSGPAYWPWQLMTNIEGVRPPQTEEYVYRRLQLGKKILTRMGELGMTPIGQGFSGHVPRRLAEKFPRAKTTVTGKWCGFPETCQLDPLDPLFQKLGTALLKKQAELLGDFAYLACDPFHENRPSSRKPGYLRRVGRAIHTLYQTAAPGSVWVMQSWSLRKAIVKAVPKEHLLILCINGQYRKVKKHFWGYSFVLGNLMNYGGKNSLHGDIGALAQNPYRQQKAKNPALAGTGLFMEGINQNPLYYDLLFDSLTRQEAFDLGDWLKSYARRRYHSGEDCLLSALSLLRQSCYNEDKNVDESASIICARPSRDVTRAAPNDTLGVRYDNTLLCRAVGKLLESAAPPTDGYLFDVCDTLRQALSNYAVHVYHALMDAVHKNDSEKYRQQKEQFLTLLTDVDRLLMTKEELTLGHWVRPAMAQAQTEEEAEEYRRNALQLVTLWGPLDNPQIFDYAWKEWGGLIKDYYLPRWQIFFKDLEEHWEEYRTPAAKKVPLAYGRPAFRAGRLQETLAAFELQFLDTYHPAPYVKEEPLAVCRELYGRYAPQIMNQTAAQTAKENKNLDFWRN